MKWLKDFIGGFFSSLWDIVKLGLDALLDGFLGLLYMVWDGFLFIVTNLVSTLDLSSLAFTQFAEWSDLPPQLIYLVNQVALPQCAAIIGGAILVRMILNIIPTWATRI